MVCFFVGVLVLMVTCTAEAQSSNGPIRLTLDMASVRERPVLDDTNPDAAGNQFGFEGGSVLKLDGVYHLFTSEMYAAPMWEPMRLAHWMSPDAIHWKRVATLYETKPGETGQRHALWSPLPVFDLANQVWNLFYVAYAPPGNTEGVIYRAISRQKGKSGIGGPYQDSAVILKRDAHSQSWEGTQGTDSFFPYQVQKQWYAFYGSHQNDTGQNWYVGLAEAPSLAGPWIHAKQGNPLVGIEPAFIENPIVTHWGHLYLAVYDCDVEGARTGYHTEAHAIGFTWSRDGVHWAEGQHVTVQPDGAAHWSKDIRTPLGLVPEGGNQFTLLYTGEEKDRKYFSVGAVTVHVSIAGEQ